MSAAKPDPNQFAIMSEAQKDDLDQRSPVGGRDSKGGFFMTETEDFQYNQ